MEPEQLAWLWLRHQPNSAFSSITIVAMARKLLIALWRYLETGVLPTGAVLKV